jgi:predicted aminopeptidase
MRRKYRPPALDVPVFAGLPLVLLCLLLGACNTLEYYSHVTYGHLQLMARREPVTQLLADPACDPLLCQRLELAQQARSFASRELALPDNRSYRLYADLQRPYVVWNLYVTPEFSVQPQLQCFPFAGCVAYRGFYDLQRARAAAAHAQLAGMDVWVGGVEAYSTLGWFDDPLLGNMLKRDDAQLAALIFHELAHQQLYVSDDTLFNESFASFVEQEGLRQWLVRRGQPMPDGDTYCRSEQFTARVLATRERLHSLYASDLPAAQMAQGKAAEFERLRAGYRAWRSTQQGDFDAYDAWIESPLNNARLLPFALYRQWLPAFAELFRQAGADWPAFYDQAARLAELPALQREQQLEALRVAAGTPACAL